MISHNNILVDKNTIASSSGTTAKTTVLNWKEKSPGVLKIGAVSYLNSKPLVRELLNRENFPHRCRDQQSPLNYELKLDYPSRLAAGLRTGEYDVALVPSVEFFLGRQAGLDYQIVSNACVAARGPVLSVKVYFRCHPGEVKSLLLDEGSRTSAMLTKILLAERYGAFPECRALSLETSPWDQQADAMLVIGDRAMQSPEENYRYVWDLGEEWLTWTGYPFVFAMWVARSSFSKKSMLCEVLEQARDLGVASINDIVKEESSRLGISEVLAKQYLTKHLHFRMQSSEKLGMELYFELVKSHLFKEWS